MSGQSAHDTTLHVRLAPSFLGMEALEDLITERSLDSQVTWIIGVLGLFLLTYYQWVFILPVDWCWNQLSVL